MRGVKEERIKVDSKGSLLTDIVKIPQWVNQSHKLKKIAVFWDSTPCKSVGRYIPNFQRNISPPSSEYKCSPCRKNFRSYVTYVVILSLC